MAGGCAFENWSETLVRIDGGQMMRFVMRMRMMNSASLISSVCLSSWECSKCSSVCLCVCTPPCTCFVSAHVFMHVCTPFIIFEGACVFLRYVCISESLHQQQSHNSSLFWHRDRGTSSLPMSGLQSQATQDSQQVSLESR